MRTVKQTFIKGWIKFLSMVLGILGVSSCYDACVPALYGCEPNNYSVRPTKYKFNGTVKNNSGEQLENIDVVLKYINTPTDTMIIGNVKTDVLGKYMFGPMYFSKYSGEQFRIICTDSYMVYTADSTDFQIQFDGDSTDMTDDGIEKQVNFVLKAKENN